jgi:hypothetical protein
MEKVPAVRIEADLTSDSRAGRNDYAIGMNGFFDKIAAG